MYSRLNNYGGRTMTQILSDDARPTALREEPDAHGQAALLLSESILHMLVETRVLSGVQARTVISAASEVKVEVAEATGESNGRMQESLMLIAQIAATFEADDEQRTGPRALGDSNH